MATRPPPCSSSRVGAAGLACSSGGRGVRVVQATWHPHSDVHLAVLSSDNTFRLFNLSRSSETAEQEYLLRLDQRIDRATAFSFGGSSRWNLFTVFFLLSTGEIYSLCPIVPFGSYVPRSIIEDLVKRPSVHADKQGHTTHGREELEDSEVLQWLIHSFPDVESGESGSTSSSQSVLVKACPYVAADRSVCLQGPFQVLNSDEHGLAASGGAFATSLLHLMAGSNSLLAVASRDGQVIVHLMEDCVEPAWTNDEIPTISKDRMGGIQSVVTVAFAAPKRQNFQDGECDSRCCMTAIVVVDLNLAEQALDAAPIVLLPDPVSPERLVCSHAAGVEAIELPLLSLATELHQGQSKATSSQAPRAATPRVFSVLDIRPLPGSDGPYLPLAGLALASSAIGETWLIAATAAAQYVVLKMPSRGALLPTTPASTELSKEAGHKLEHGGHLLIGNLASGPEDIGMPRVLHCQALVAQSIEGRASLHEGCKMLHKKHIEYAHKLCLSEQAYVELKGHHGHLRETVKLQRHHMQVCLKSLEDEEARARRLVNRLSLAAEFNVSLEKRILRFDALQRHDLELLRLAVQDLSQEAGGGESAVATASAANLAAAAGGGTLGARNQPRLEEANGHPSIRVPAMQMRKLKIAVDQLALSLEDMMHIVKRLEEETSTRELQSAK
eukprot:SM000099S25239  [mRNA]  locus=s99:457096:460822:+ [translate_table: standard]